MGYIIKISFKNKGVQDMKIFGKEFTFNGNKVYHAGNKPTVSEIGAAASSHTHNYAGSSSAGGAANSALTATKATQDSAGQQINTTYIKGLSVSGKTITYTKGDGTTGTITTQDTNTTYSTGTATTSGLTKLYTGTGTATDGTMTQAAINTALSGKAASSHTHNYAGSSSAGGAANSANTLATARKINGTSFDGSANITTANWGTARIITIGSTGKSVNGSGSVSWTLREIGAAAASHTHSYLPLSGGAVTGNIVPNGAYNLGSQSNQWVDVFIRGSFINNVAGRGEGYFAFSNGSQFATAIYGKENGEIGIYDSLRSRHVFMYTFQNNNFTLTFSNNLKPSASNAFDLGDSSARWRTVYAINGFNTSDKNHKENIEYIPDNIKCISNDTTKNSKITYEDMYNFYKDIKLATYNYKNQEHKEFGFIAQDISETKVGSQIALNLEDGYMYSVGSYISSVAGALKQCINEIELLKEINKELHEEIYTLKNEL